MKLPPYIEFNIPDKQGLNDYFILSTNAPGYYAQIAKVGQEIAEIAIYNLDPKCFCQITGYNIFLLFKGALPSNAVHNNWAMFSGKADAGVKSTLDAMGEWYLIHVIGKRLSEFERFSL